MSYADQDMFFAEVYHTGDDLWKVIPFKRHAQKLMLFVPKGSSVLDIGAGRGHMLRELGKFGFRVVGLENNENIVEDGNHALKKEGLEQDLRLVPGDALNIPFTDGIFDAAFDVSHLIHVDPSNFQTYVSETSRVLKQGGLFMLALLSKNTPRYFKWNPSEGDKADYELEGVRYHFFTEEEIHRLFGEYFEIIKIKADSPFGKNDTEYLITLLKKK
jgi:ubiquinone/menaquinone biosynthesis C-methylase UbiE